MCTHSGKFAHGEHHTYYACDVTLSVYPHWARLKNMPDHGGNRTYDLWNTSPMLCQLSYAVWSVRVCDISEQNWASIPKVVGSIPTVVRHIFKLARCGYTLRVTSQHHIHLSTLHQQKSCLLLDNIDIEGTRFCSEISHTRTDQTT